MRMRWLSKAAVIAVCFGCLCSCPIPGNAQTGDAASGLVREASFPDGGSVTLEMNIGDLRIMPAEKAGSLRLELHPDRDAEEAPAWVREFSVAGPQAKIVIKTPKGNNRSGVTTLYVPKNTNLKLHLGIGDLTVGQVSGDKNLEVGIGDLKLRAEPEGEYRSVHAATGIGDVHDAVFHLGQSGWLGKHENKDFGQGAYRLQVHVTIGDVSIEPEQKDQAKQ